MDGTGFDPHGVFRMGIVDRVFCIEIHDAWNLEGLERYLEACRPRIRTLIDGRPWASFVDVSNATLSTPDTVEPFRAEARRLSEAGRRDIALVGARSDWQRLHVDNMFAGTGAVVRYFDDPQAAWLWLADSGFCDGPPATSPFD